MNRILTHTVEQPESDTTTFVLSCNRLEVLDQTLRSFYATRDYVTRMVIVDDSAQPGVFEALVSRYGADCDVICFPRNRSQWWAMDFMVSYCDTDYIFYLEDDWELLKPGYLNLSKQILEKYRDVGVVDTSWRTFEWQGIDSYERELVDGCFYWKKPWKITDHHMAWHAWVGSPNLRRRDDLIMLGRVEKWHNEWNIDRKFTALGFKGVFLNGEYSRHLGDDCSRMADRRPDDSKIPYDFYPPEILKNRRAPFIDYREMDWVYEYPSDVTLVTALVDLGRNDRDFMQHYIQGLDKLLAVRNPLAVYCDPKYHEHIVNRRRELSIATSDNKITVRPLTIESIEAYEHFARIQKIISQERWISQSSWMRNSVINSPYYIPLTLMKPYLLEEIVNENPLGSKRFYWIDSGIYNSYGIQEPIREFDFLKLPKDNFSLSAFPYLTDSEIHGYNIGKMTELVGYKPTSVCRATIFGGSQDQIKKFNQRYFEYINKSLEIGAIGAEEAIFTIVALKHPELVNVYAMPNGDVKHYLNTIRR